MNFQKNCNCGICDHCNSMYKDTIADEKGMLFIEILDPETDKILKGLSEILPPTNIEEVFMINALRISSGLVKVAAKHKPNNPKLWSKCIAEAKKKFKVFPSAYANGFAARLYKKKGGTWRTIKGKK